MPLPHFSQATPGVGQANPLSTAEHVELQPSPLAVLPSSHVSPGSTLPLPQVMHGVPAVPQVYPTSIALQSKRQPSPLRGYRSSEACWEFF